MGKKGFKVKTYEAPDEKFVVIVNAWGKARDRQQFTNAVGAWFEVMLRRIYPKQKLQLNCIYYQSTHDILIVELPPAVSSLEPFLGAHPYRSFLTNHPTSTEFAYIYEYNFRHFNHPENTNWHASMPSYRELPRSLPVKNPYPLPREIEGIGMLPTPHPPANARYAIPVPVPPPPSPPPAPVQEERCSPAPVPPPRPTASTSGSSSTTPNPRREYGPDSQTLDPRKRPPSPTPGPAPPPQPPQASTSTPGSMFTPYNPPSHHPAHSTLTTARSGGAKGKERELPAQLHARSSVSRTSSVAVDDFLGSILPPPLPPSSTPTPPVQVKSEEIPVKLEDEGDAEVVRVKPEPQDDDDYTFFASPPPPTYYPPPTGRPLRIKAEPPIEDSRPRSVEPRIKPEPSEEDDDAMAALRMMPPPPLPLRTRVKPEPIDDDDIDLRSSRAPGYARSQSEMWVKQELLLDPSRMRRSESVLDPGAREQSESGDWREGEDQEDEREGASERPAEDKEDDTDHYQPSAELLDAFASLEGDMGFDLFGSTDMEVDVNSVSSDNVTVKTEPKVEEEYRACMNDFSDRRSVDSAPSTTRSHTLASETSSIASPPSSSRSSDASRTTRTPTQDPRQTQTPSDRRLRITVKEEPRDESLSTLRDAPTSHYPQSPSARRTSMAENQRGHPGREGEKERSLTMPSTSPVISRDVRSDLVKIKSEPWDDMMIDSDRRSATLETHNQSSSSSSSYGDPRRTLSRRDRSESDFELGKRRSHSRDIYRHREDNAGRKRAAQNGDQARDGYRGVGVRGVEGKDDRERQGSSWSGLKFKRLKREPA